MAILTKFLDFATFGTRDLGHNGKKLEKNTIYINHYICPIFHVENNLSKLQFNFDFFYLADFDPSWACSFVTLGKSF